MGVFLGAITTHLVVIFQACLEFRPSLSAEITSLEIPASCPSYIVGAQSRNLIKVNRLTLLAQEYQGQCVREYESFLPPACLRLASRLVTCTWRRYHGLRSTPGDGDGDQVAPYMHTRPSKGGGFVILT